MTRVLNGNVWIDDRFYAKGTAPTGPIADRIGAHLWSELSGEPVQHVTPPVAVQDNQPRVTVEQPSQFLSVPVTMDPVAPPVPPATGVPVEPITAHQEAEPDGGWGEPEGDPVPPPRSGLGGSQSAWHAYAVAVGVDVQPGYGRNEIIAAVKQAGLPV